MKKFLTWIKWLFSSIPDCPYANWDDILAGIASCPKQGPCNECAVPEIKGFRKSGGERFLEYKVISDKENSDGH